MGSNSSRHVCAALSCDWPAPRPASAAICLKKRSNVAAELLAPLRRVPTSETGHTDLRHFVIFFSLSRQMTGERLESSNDEVILHTFQTIIITSFQAHKV